MIGNFCNHEPPLPPPGIRRKLVFLFIRIWQCVYDCWWKLGGRGRLEWGVNCLCLRVYKSKPTKTSPERNNQRVPWVRSALSFKGGSSHRRKSAACPKFDMVWLYRSPITVGSRVSTEVTFWHSAEYGSDFRLNSGEIPRNSAEFRGISPELSRNHFRSKKIPRNSVSAEFRGHPSGEEGANSLVQMIFTCLRYTLRKGEGIGTPWNRQAKS